MLTTTLLLLSVLSTAALGQERSSLWFDTSGKAFVGDQVELFTYISEKEGKKGDLLAEIFSDFFDKNSDRPPELLKAFLWIARLDLPQEDIAETFQLGMDALALESYLDHSTDPFEPPFVAYETARYIEEELVRTITRERLQTSGAEVLLRTIAELNRTPVAPVAVELVGGWGEGGKGSHFSQLCRAYTRKGTTKLGKRASWMKNRKEGIRTIIRRTSAKYRKLQ